MSKAKRSIHTSLLLVLGVATGAAFALLASKPIFNFLPTDLGRIKVVLDAMNDPDLKPDTLAFGNSVIMAGLDARIINERLSSQHEAFNLATTGQNTIESYLYYQEIPESVSLIIQFVNTGAIGGAIGLAEQKYNAFYMFGYRPDNQTEADIVTILGGDIPALFEKSDIEQRFTSRWAIRQMADNLARSTFRGMQFDRAINDLQFPSRMGAQLTDAKMRRTLRLKYKNKKELAFRLNKKKRLFLTEIIKRAKTGGRNYVLVIEPVHPLVYELRADNYYADARAAFKQLSQQYNTPVIDASDAVPSDMFADGIHPDEAGAKLLSNFVADELIKLYEAGELHK